MIGKIKYAPGTFASLISCFLFLFLINIFHIAFLLLIMIIIFFYSFIAINNSFGEFESDDPKEIVIDEVLGQMLVLLAMPIYEILYPLPGLYYYILSFLLFRLFDVWKPFPVSYADNKIKGTLGIMLDDILAALYSILIMIVIFFFLGG